jgi:murein DD-endopeptidase MepM/ murein hydrolase activator NlpD
MPLRFAFWIVLWLSALPGLVGGHALADDLPASAVDEYFAYPLRAGESLSDVARTFHVSVQDLTSINHLGDVDHLQIGQTIRVPNGFARETAALRAEGIRVLEEKRRVERESAERQRALVDLQARQRQLEAERNTLAAELATLGSWRLTAKITLALFLLALAWAFKSRIERARTARKHAAMAAHNAALSAAKERYRQAAAQLELRYQKLYGGLAEPVSGTVRDGLDRIRAAFGEGSAEIERQLARLAGARAADRESVHAEEKGRVWIWIPHPVRELLERNRLKYHTP